MTAPQPTPPWTAPSQLVTRRRAVGLLAGAGLATALAACSSGSTPSPPVRRTSSGPTPTTRPRRTAPTVADWRSLGHQLDGSLRQPGQAAYDVERLLFDRLFDGSRPQAVARPATQADVATAIGFARHHGLPLNIRSGGHSYIGASSGPGLVIDLRGLNSVTVDSSAGTATLGAGIALVDAYAELAAHDVSIPAGSCASVGLSGLALGGGIGVVARRYGLTCDRLLSAEVVTADGQTLTCDATHHADLYWALRGGGGSFGVVTSMTLTTHPADPLAHAFLAWPWSAAADVLTAWQPFATHAPDALWSTCHVLATDVRPGAPTIAVVAVMVGASADLDSRLGALVEAIPTAPTSRFVAEAGYLDTMLLESGCADYSLTACHVGAETPGGKLSRDAFVAGSDYFRRTIPAGGVRRLVQAVEQRQADPRLGAGGASFDVLGGAVDKLAPHATAYVHRGALFNAQYTASWQDTPGNGPLARNRRSLASIHSAVRRYASGEAYQNYADATLPDPQQAYYGSNLSRLVDVRRSYDPTGVFTQRQGVPLT